MNNRWMNGQHLRALPPEELSKLIGERWKTSGLLTMSAGPYIDVRPNFHAFFIRSPYSMSFILWNLVVSGLVRCYHIL